MRAHGSLSDQVPFMDKKSHRLQIRRQMIDSFSHIVLTNVHIGGNYMSISVTPRIDLTT